MVEVGRFDMENNGTVILFLIFINWTEDGIEVSTDALQIRELKNMITP